jgi:hypothetical protein
VLVSIESQQEHMSEASDRSDESRSAGGSNAGVHPEHKSHVIDDSQLNLSYGKPTASLGSLSASTLIEGSVSHKSQQQYEGFTKKNSEERCLTSSTPINASWDEVHSFDETEDRNRFSARSATSYVVRDRRKQFDATTPTLIDEEDDSEILSIDQSRIQRAVAYDKDETLIRRTPGASMYKSSLEAAVDEGPNMSKSPGATVVHGSSGALPQSMPSPYQHHLGNQNEGIGIWSSSIRSRWNL